MSENIYAKIESKLEDLYVFRVNRDNLQDEKERAIVSLISADKLAKYNEIVRKYDQDVKDNTSIIEKTEAEIREDALELKQSVKTDKLSAIYVGNSEIWDSEKLDNLMKRVPELQSYRKPKKDSVRIQ